MRHILKAVTFGILAALILITFTLNFQATPMLGAPTASAERLTAKDFTSGAAQPTTLESPQSIAYISLLYSLISAVLIFQVSARILEKKKLQ